MDDEGRHSIPPPSNTDLSCIGDEFMERFEVEEGEGTEFQVHVPNPLMAAHPPAAVPVAAGAVEVPLPPPEDEPMVEVEPIAAPAADPAPPGPRPVGPRERRVDRLLREAEAFAPNLFVCQEAEEQRRRLRVRLPPALLPPPANSEDVQEEEQYDPLDSDASGESSSSSSREEEDEDFLGFIEFMGQMQLN